MENNDARIAENNMESNPLRGAVLGKYRSLSAFSRAIGWSLNKTSRIVNGEQLPDSDEMCQIAEAIPIKCEEEFMSIFFGELSTKWTMC